MAIVNDTPKRFTSTNDVTGALIKSKADFIFSALFISV